jgi:excisionase family DNA binding protein
MRALSTLAELAAQLELLDARRLADVPREAIPELLGEIARVEALLRLRLTDPIATSSPAVSEDRWLTAGEVAGRAGFKTPYVLELCRRGTLPSVRQGKYVRIPESGFRAWQAARTNPLDRAGSVTLPSHHDAGRGSPRPQGARAVAVEIRRAPRRTPRDGQEMGDGGSGPAQHQRAADSAPGGPRYDGAA